MKSFGFVVAFILSFIYVSSQNNDINVNVNEEYYSETHSLDVSFTTPSHNNFKRAVKNTPLSGIQAVVNVYADHVFANIRQWMINNGSSLEPFALPDMTTGFNFTFIITYYGELELVNGQMHDLSQIHRGGDVTVLYSSNSNYLLVTVPVAFGAVSFEYDYSAKLMGLGPTGGIEGQVNGIVVELKVGFNTDTFVASLDDFTILNAGHVSFHFTGHPIVDLIINVLTEVVTTLLKSVILWVLQNVVAGGLQTVIEQVNEEVQIILNPNTNSSVSLFN